MKIETIEQAREAGRLAANEGGTPTFGLNEHLTKLGVPLALQSAWMGAYEDELERQGFDLDPDSDGYGWERRALSRI